MCRFDSYWKHDPKSEKKVYEAGYWNISSLSGGRVPEFMQTTASDDTTETAY